MNNEVTVKGVWWLPEKPERRLAGEITYGSNSGARLSLYDHFFENPMAGGFAVWGMTVKGEDVSLFNCHATSISAHFIGGRVAEIVAYSGVIGGHFQSADQMKFIKVTAELSHLHEWAWRSGLQLTRKKSGKGWQVTHDMLPEIRLAALGDFELGLEFTGQLLPEYGKCSLSENCLLAVEAKKLMPFESFETIILQFQGFVALALTRPVYTRSLKGRIDKPKAIIQGQSIYDDFEIIRKDAPRDEKNERLMPHDMQFCLVDLQPEPSAFIKQYFEKRKLLEPVSDLYLSTLYNPRMYVQQRYLALAHAIEAYHRAFVGGKYQSNDEYRDGLEKRLWDAVPETIDPDFRSSLKNKLKYLHEFSLRKRVRDICEKYSTVLTPYLGEATAFASAVADQRNLLTHPDPTSEEQRPPIDLIKVWLKCEQLSLLLEVCLLHEIGFSEEEVSKLMQRNRRIQAIQLNRK